MKTAVEWLTEKLRTEFGFAFSNNIFEQAKEMEKRQIIDVYRDGRSDQQSERPSKFYNRNAEQYYNETFK
jgi:HEPN domain-containing protein